VYFEKGLRVLLLIAHVSHVHLGVVISVAVMFIPSQTLLRRDRRIEVSLKCANRLWLKVYLVNVDIFDVIARIDTGSYLKADFNSLLDIIYELFFISPAHTWVPVFLSYTLNP